MAVRVTQVHGSALAVAPHLAVPALTRLHPAAVTVQFESVFPDIPEIICVDIALMVVTAYAQAARNRTVIKYGGDTHTGYTAEQMVTDNALIRTEKAFT